MTSPTRTNTILGVDPCRGCPGCGKPVPDTQEQGALCRACGHHLGQAAGPLDGSDLARVLAHPDLVGKYELLEKLGQGSFGAVFVARDRQLERKVALKFLLDADPGQLARFEKEGRVLARLSHSHLLRIFSAEVVGGVPVLVLELLVGRTVKSELELARRIPWPRALQIVGMALEGLVAAHEAGVVHRDIKPENLLLPDDGGLKVLDFGLARSVDRAGTGGSASLTAAGTVMGTPAYMSPEQCRGDPVDIRTDLYSLGVVLFELVTGRLPFTGASAVELLAAHLKDEPLRPSDLAPGLPPDLDEVVAAALAKQRVLRYPTAKAMAEALDRVRASAPRPDEHSGGEAIWPGVGPDQERPTRRVRTRPQSRPGTRKTARLALTAPAPVAPPRLKRRVQWLGALAVVAAAAHGGMMTHRSRPSGPAGLTESPIRAARATAAGASSPGRTSGPSTRPLPALPVDPILGGPIIASDTECTDLLVAGRGSHVVVAWCAQVGPHERAVRVCESLDRGTSWSSPVTLDRRRREPRPAMTPPGQGDWENSLVAHPRVLVGRCDVQVFWMAEMSGTALLSAEDWRPWVCRRSVAGGSWSTPTAIVVPVSWAGPALAEVAERRVALLHRLGTEIRVAAWHAAAPTRGGSDMILSSPGLSSGADLRLLSVGRGLLALARFTPAGSPTAEIWATHQLQAAVGPWSPPVRVAWEESRSVGAFDAVAHEDGTVVLAYESSGEVRVRRSGEGGRNFSKPIATLASTRSAEAPLLAIAGGEIALVRMETHHVRGLDVLEAVMRRKGRAPGQRVGIDVWTSREGARWVHRRRDWPEVPEETRVEGMAVTSAGDTLLMVVARRRSGLVMVRLPVAPVAAAVPDLLPRGKNRHGILEFEDTRDGSLMVLIPAGSFAMGSNDGDDNEKPVHQVHVGAFYMDQHEVTNRRYRQFLSATWHLEPGIWKDPSRNGDDQPVTGVSWDDAQAYCRWAGKRLPTEAEWEKASRGGLEGKTYPWGDDRPEGRAAYMDITSAVLPSLSLAPVGRYAPNGYGLHDMAGNVREWCMDRGGDVYYQASETRDPQGPTSGMDRVVRDGSWNYHARALRCSNRGFVNPNDRSKHIGFRCVRPTR